MAHPFIKAACASAGLVLALVAAGTAHAAKPITGKPSTSKQPLTIEQKIAMGQAMARNQQKVPPKTMAKAEATMRKDGGVTVIDVPEELYHYLTASADAHGNMVVRDVDAAGHSTAAAVEASNEK